MSNVFIFSGTIGRDAEVRHTTSGLAVLSFTVANNIGFGDKQQTLWLQVTLFGKRAEGQLQNYLKKGQQVFVSGELTQREYQAKDGTTKTSLDLNANIVELVGGRSQANQEPVSKSQANQEPVSKSQANQEPVSKPATERSDYDNDIPF